MIGAVQFIVWLIVGRSASMESIFQSRMVLSQPGKAYAPMSEQGQLISICSTSSLTRCAMACNRDVRCRIFDYQAISLQECRLFEGDAVTMGTILPSSSPKSLVGLVQFTSHLYMQHGLPCSPACAESRYLFCDSAGTYQCVEHTYWNGSMCLPQSTVLGSTCAQNSSMCREDLNYTCLRFNQCGRKFSSRFVSLG